MLALVLGIVVSSGLYFAYLWPTVEPVEPPDRGDEPGEPAAATTTGADHGDAASTTP
jgi:hypothetical protein